MRRVAMAIGVLLLVAFPMVSGLYEIHVANVAGVYAILTLGMYIAFGMAGQISIAQGAFWGIGAYTTALLLTQGGLSFWLALPASGLAAAIVGVLVGLPVIRVRRFYLGMATVGFQELASLVFINWVPVTHGADGIGSIPGPAIGPLVLGDQRQVFYLIVAAVAVAYVTTDRLRHSRMGRACEALREDPLAAQAAGVDVVATKLLAFALAGLYAGVAGSLYAVQIHYIEPKAFGLGVSVTVFAMMFFGGHRHPAGAVIGAVTLILLPEFLKFMQNYYMALYGAGIIVLIVYHPEGVVSLLAKGMERLSQLVLDRTAGRERAKKALAEPAGPEGA